MRYAKIDEQLVAFYGGNDVWDEPVGVCIVDPDHRPPGYLGEHRRTSRWVTNLLVSLLVLLNIAIMLVAFWR